MSSAKKTAVAIIFLLILAGLGTTDALLTRGTLRLPTVESETTQPGLDVVTLVESKGFTATETDEQFLLEKILLPGTPVASRVLLKDNDRVSALAWIETQDVKHVFTSLKESLRGSFSPDLKDLIDETQSEPGKPPRDVLSFSDPAILPDRVLFTRVRQRLYEFHVTPGKEADVDGLLNALTE